MPAFAGMTPELRSRHPDESAAPWPDTGSTRRRVRLHAVVPGFRRDDDSPSDVIPAKAGIHPGPHSPRYAARTFGSLSSVFASPLIVTSPESIT